MNAMISRSLAPFSATVAEKYFLLGRHRAELRRVVMDADGDGAGDDGRPCGRAKAKRIERGGARFAFAGTAINEAVGPI
ncbi:hypothetical protein [Xanthobacter agilis]|uniref:Uncharacterized protein n=1 Tax=Xanthobacter agilis TaxID=47492 RepID=A0ABU0LAF5_XANAG|nr:hypothetical protein [Xanthobacter agilis]MDQ0504115.1 hypothetical protein [Xanthobacter agilis]